MIKIHKSNGRNSSCGPSVTLWRLTTSNKAQYIGYQMTNLNKFYCVLSKNGKSVIVQDYQSFLYCGIFTLRWCRQTS